MDIPRDDMFFKKSFTYHGKINLKSQDLNSFIKRFRYEYQKISKIL